MIIIAFFSLEKQVKPLGQTLKKAVANLILVPNRRFFSRLQGAFRVWRCAKQTRFAGFQTAGKQDNGEKIMSLMFLNLIVGIGLASIVFGVAGALCMRGVGR